MPEGTIAEPFDQPGDWAVSGRAGLFKDLLTPAGLAEVRSYADGVFAGFADTDVAARVMLKLEADAGYARCLAHDNACTDRD